MFMKYIFIILLILSSFNAKAQLEKEYTIPIENDSINLSGTLIYPKKNFNKIIVIIPGSGKDNRLSHHKLSNTLIKNNIAVFRFDDKGVGKSGGKFYEGLTGLDIELKSIVSHLKKTTLLKNKKFGFIGHSLGGAIILNSIKLGTTADFYVFIASPPEQIANLFAYQASRKNLRSIFKFGGKGDTKKSRPKHVKAINQIIYKYSNDSIANNKAKAYLKEHQLKRLFTPYYWDWYKDLIRQDIEEVYDQINQPSLVVVGEKDDKIDYKSTVKKFNSLQKQNFTVKTFKGLNHYLKKGKEYKDPYNMEKAPLQFIINWIKEQ